MSGHQNCFHDCKSGGLGYAIWNKCFCWKRLFVIRKTLLPEKRFNNILILNCSCWNVHCRAITFVHQNSSDIMAEQRVLNLFDGLCYKINCHIRKPVFQKCLQLSFIQIFYPGLEKYKCGAWYHCMKYFWTIISYAGMNKLQGMNTSLLRKLDYATLIAD